MAYTQIHAIKATVNKAIDYITNPDKTDEKMLVDSFACAPETAHFDFAATLSKTHKKNPNLAYHLIQSFAPGEVSYEEAHAIGHELADKLLKGKYAYVLTTHIDKNHIHNHLIFCSTDFVNHEKYHDCKSTYYEIRKLSDTLCANHGLSVIIPGKKRGLKYNEWLANKDGLSIKERLKKQIDECIAQSQTYDDFLIKMRAAGVEIKGEFFSEGALKYISFRPPESKQFFRGYDRTFGTGYTKEEIKIRIENKELLTPPVEGKTTNPNIENSKEKGNILLSNAPENILLSKNTKSLTATLPTKFIDTTTERMKSSPGLLKWAETQNLKYAMSLYAKYGSVEELRAQIEDKTALLESLKETLSSLEAKLRTASEIAHYASVFKENERYNNAMKRSKDPDRYYREHADKLHLYHAAEDLLSRKYDINAASLDVVQMKANLALMQGKTGAIKDQIIELKSELKHLKKDHASLHDYLNYMEHNENNMSRNTDISKKKPYEYS